jgi:hypothetical protein
MYACGVAVNADDAYSPSSPSSAPSRHFTTEITEHTENGALLVNGNVRLRDVLGVLAGRVSARR